MQGLASSARSSLVQQRCSFHTRFSGQRHSNRPHTVVLDHTLLTTHKRSSAWIHLGIVCSYEHIIPNSIYNSFYLGTFPPLSHVGCWPSRLAWRCVPVTCEMTRGRAISVHQSRAAGDTHGGTGIHRPVVFSVITHRYIVLH